MQSCRGFPVGVPELRGGAEELNKQARASTQPQPLQTTISLSFSLAWPTNHITASCSAGSRFPLRSVGTLRSSCYPTISSGWLMGLSALPFLLAFFLFFPSNAAERCGSLSWLPLSCPHLCSHHMLRFQEIIPHPLFSPVRAILKQSLFVFRGGGADGRECFSAWGSFIIFKPCFFSLALSLAHIYIYWSLFLAPVISRWIITFTIFI